MNADEGMSTTQQAKDAAGQMTDQLRSKSADVMDTAQQTATQTVSEQKGRAAERVGDLADALRHTAEHLHENDQSGFGRMANQAADRLEQFSNDLQNKSVDEIVADIQDFARRDPGLFLAGLLGARFFRSSARRNKFYGVGQPRSYQAGGMKGGDYYGRQTRGHYGPETTQEDYTGTYAPRYSGSGTTTETTGSTYGARQPSTQAPNTRPAGYPPETDMGARPQTDPLDRMNPVDPREPGDPANPMDRTNE